MADQAAQHPPKESVKETLISIIIAFILAFAFRGFVIEAFVIPTGSMAPTLLGQHMRFQSEDSGANWPVGPWNYVPNNTGRADPVSVQGSLPGPPVLVHDPMSGSRSEHRNEDLRAGDRILVLKYLYALHEPRRYDVIVFKNPAEPSVNYIKRLIGLPNEELALVDGDVFVHPRQPGDKPASWTDPAWTIAPRPDDVAREVWQPVFDSAFTPLRATTDGGRWFRSPWEGAADGEGSKWQIEDRRSYTYTGTGPTRLSWNSLTPMIRTPNAQERWAITDRYPYNETSPPGAVPIVRFPVGDLRLRAAIEIPASAAAAPSVQAIVLARGHEFRAVVDGATAHLQMRPAGDAGGVSTAPWSDLAQATIAPLTPGSITDLEFWHIDQQLELWINHRRVAYATYSWTPAQRLQFATGLTLESLLAADRPAGEQLSDPTRYRPASAAWAFSAGPVTMHRVGLDRDLYYRPDKRRSVPGLPPAWATHPTTTMALGPDQFFACGDNSPSSEDSRLWGPPDPWAALIDPTPGVVPRELLLGKAFFVYFPALAGSSPVPMPDFGRLRFIR